MGFLSWIVFGLIAGAIAKALHPGPDPGGCLGTIIIGVLGAVIGGWLGSMFFNIATPNDFSLQSFLVAIAGAILLLIIYRAVIGRRR